MHILITGAAGMIGRKLTERLVVDRELNGQPVEKLTLIDIVAPTRPASFSDHVKTRAADLAEPGVAAKAVSERPDVIFHLAGVVSGEAEIDFEKGYRVNLDGSRALLEAIRAVGDGYKPRVIFTSSMAVFGAPFPHAIPDDFHLTPLTSYGTQKAITELMLADYTRRGILEGVGIRLPSIVVRPGKPNKAASGFFSGIIREPLAGHEAMLPVADTVVHTHASPRSAVGFLIHAAGLDRAAARAAHQPQHAGRVLHRRRADRGAAPDRRREGRGAHPPRAGRADHAHRRRLAAPLRSAARDRARLPVEKARSTRSSACTSRKTSAGRSRLEWDARRHALPAPLIPATLVKRYKRFLADVVLPDGDDDHRACRQSGRDDRPRRARLAGVAVEVRQSEPQAAVLAGS